MAASLTFNDQDLLLIPTDPTAATFIPAPNVVWNDRSLVLAMIDFMNKYGDTKKYPVPLIVVDGIHNITDRVTSLWQSFYPHAYFYIYSPGNQVKNQSKTMNVYNKNIAAADIKQWHSFQQQRKSVFFFSALPTSSDNWMDIQKQLLNQQQICAGISPEKCSLEFKISMGSMPISFNYPQQYLTKYVWGSSNKVRILAGNKITPIDLTKLKQQLAYFNNTKSTLEYVNPFTGDKTPVAAPNLLNDWNSMAETMILSDFFKNKNTAYNAPAIKTYSDFISGNLSPVKKETLFNLRTAIKAVTPTTVAPAKIAPATVAPAKIAPATVAPAKIAPATVAPAKIAPATVAPAKIAPATVAPAKIAPATVAPAKIAPATVAPAKIVPTTVAPAKIVPTTIAPAKIVPAVTTPAAKIAPVVTTPAAKMAPAATTPAAKITPALPKDTEPFAKPVRKSVRRDKITLIKKKIIVTPTDTKVDVKNFEKADLFVRTTDRSREYFSRKGIESFGPVFPYSELSKLLHCILFMCYQVTSSSGNILLIDIENKKVVTLLEELFPNYTFYVVDKRINQTDTDKIKYIKKYFNFYDSLDRRYKKTDFITLKDIPKLTYEGLISFRRSTDTRRMSSRDACEAQRNDMLDQLELVEMFFKHSPDHTVKAVSLKFILPYSDCGHEFFKYPNGFLVKLPFGSRSSTISMLWVDFTTDKFSYEHRNWHIKNYEDRMFYFNSVTRRLQGYNNAFTDTVDPFLPPQLISDYDSNNMVYTIKMYFEKMAALTEPDSGILAQKLCLYIIKTLNPRVNLNQKRINARAEDAAINRSRIPVARV